MRVLIATVVAACLVPAAADARPPSFVIRTSQGAVARIGAFHPSRRPTIAAAIRAFGRPTSRRLTNFNECRVEWRRLGLRIDFANLGGPRPGETTCSPAVGQAQTFTARGSRFITSAGLRVGDPSSAIPAIYPLAALTSGTWWLVTAISPFGDQGEYPVIRAIIGGGRVRAIAGFIGAAGE